MTLTIKASELQPGDFINSSYENGRRPGSITVGSVTRRADHVLIFTAFQCLEYPTGEMVSVSRY